MEDKVAEILYSEINKEEKVNECDHNLQESKLRLHENKKNQEKCQQY